MYSVLIQNQKTMDSFHQYRPIFMNALNREEIGTCLWAEAGTTIETAVPELYDLIQDKEEWRAVIVRVEDGACMQSMQAAPDNPYDFVGNTADGSEMQESNVPLIRLTHMLGGVPAPSIQFIPRIEKEEGKEPRVIYEPAADKETKHAYDALCQKYRFYGPRPSEIILISLRKKQEIRRESIEKNWQNNNETDRSEFWKRNHYPSICRFVCIDVEDKGAVQLTADLFSVWTTVMLLSTNSIDPSTLQAYMLHQVSVTFDKDILTEVLQETVSRSLSARHYIQKGLQRELEQETKEDVVVPDYTIQVPVTVKLPSHKDVSINPQAFHLTSRTPTSDADLWRDMRDKAESEMDTVEVSAKRALEQSADLMRHMCYFRDSEIFPLNKYQAEDMEAGLTHLHRKIYDARAALPKEMEGERKKLDELIQNVKEYIFERLTRKQALLFYAVAAAALLLTFVPSVLYEGRNLDWKLMLVAALFGLAAFGVAELIPLLVQMIELRGALKLFNRFAGGIVTRTAENAAKYSHYMGDIASFMRGNSFLTIVKRKNYFRDEAQYYKRNHIVALSAFLQQLQEWSTAFHLSISFERAEMDQDFVMDTDLAPQINPLYTFEEQSSYSVLVNTTGDTIESPFRFVQRLNIKREELYDDAG